MFLPPKYGIDPRQYGKVTRVCPSPVRTRVRGLQTQRPCGQCLPCLEKYQAQIIARCVAESASRASLTATLTLDDQKVNLYPWEFGSHWKKQIRNLRDRILRHTGYRPKVRWKAELGETLGRPHAHVCLFGVPSSWVPSRQQKNLVVPWWKYGTVTLDTLSVNSARYTIGYIYDDEKKDLEITKGRSTCIGLDYFRLWMEHMKQGREKHGCRYTYYPDESGLLTKACFEVDHVLYPMDCYLRNLATANGLLEEISPEQMSESVEAMVKSQVITDGGPLLYEQKQIESARKQVARKREIHRGSQVREFYHRGCVLHV